MEGLRMESKLVLIGFADLLTKESLRDNSLVNLKVQPSQTELNTTLGPFNPFHRRGYHSVWQDVKIGRVLFFCICKKIRKFVTNKKSKKGEPHF